MRAIKLLFKCHLANKNVCVTGDILVHLLGTMEPKKVIRTSKYCIIYSFYVFCPIYCSIDDLSSPTLQVLLVTPTVSQEWRM